MLHKKTKKILLGSLITLTGAVAITTPLVIHHSINNKTDLNERERAKVGVDSDVLAQYRHDVLSKIAKKVYYLDYEKSGGVINAGQIKNDIIKQTGTLLNKVQSSVKERTGKYTSDQDKTETEYYAIQKEARLIGADVMDNNVALKQNNYLTSKYYEHLISTGITPKDAQTKTALLGNIYQSTINKSKDNLWDEFQFEEQFIQDATNQGLLEDKRVAGESWTTIKQTSIGAQMLSQLGLTYIQNKLNDFLLVNTESDFVKSMKDYSNTGKYDVGNEIVDKDLGTLFKFGYDKTQGAIISDDSVNLNDVGINIDNLQATDSTEYDQGNMLFETKDFTNYNGYGGTYGMAEFMPGFKLHVKIINKDVTTKSQICHLDLLMGVSVIDQSTGKYSDIAWSEANGENNKGKLSIDLKTTQDEVKYISNNNYYAKVDTVNVADGQYDNNNDSFYGTNLAADTRISLSRALSNATTDDNDDYIVDEKHPIYLSAKDCGGIDAPQITGSDEDGNYHSTQTLKLKITNCNTNDPSAGSKSHGYSLKAHWVVMDTDNKGQTFEAKTFDWSYNDKKYDDIWISFYIDVATSKRIHDATTILLAMNQFAYVASMKQVYNDNHNDLDNTISQRQALAITMGVNIAVLIAQVAVDTYLAVTTFGTVGKLSVILGGIAIAALIASTTLESINVQGMKNTKKEWKRVNDHYTIVSDSYEKVGGTLLSQYPTIVDPKKMIDIKSAAANNVLETLQSSGFLDHYADFIVEMEKDYAADSGKPMSDSAASNLKTIITNFTTNTTGSWAIGLTITSIVSTFVSLIIKINRVNLASVRNFFRTPIEPPANRDLVGNYTSGFEPFSQEGLLSSYDADRAEQEFARLYAAGEAERAAAVARGTVLEDSSSSDAIIHGGKEGNRGNPAAFVVFTAIDLIMQSIEGIYDNIEGKGFTLDNFDPTNRYAIQTNNRFFNKDSKVGDEIQFTLNDITKKPITPTNVVWGIDNPKDVGGYLTMDASNGKLKLLAIPPNAIKVSVNVTFHYIFNGNERSSQVQWIVDMF